MTGEEVIIRRGKTRENKNWETNGEAQAFPPNARGAVDWAKVHSWIAKRQARANIYFTPNSLMKPINKKASRGDIAAMVAAHVDVDVRDGEDQAEGIARILAKLEAYSPPPSTIVVSGGGAQAYWRASKPIEINGDVAKAEAYKLINLKIEDDLGGDSCHDLSRIMRLPHTINIPNTIKLEKGRKMAPAYVVKNEPDLLYDLGRFPRAEAQRQQQEPPKREKTGPDGIGVDIDALPVSERIKNLIRGIDDPEHPYPSRSERVMAVLVKIPFWAKELAFSRSGGGGLRLARAYAFARLGRTVV